MGNLVNTGNVDIFIQMFGPYGQTRADIVYPLVGMVGQFELLRRASDYII